MENKKDIIEVVKIKKTRNRQSKYTEEEKRIRRNLNQQKYQQKPEIKEKLSKYYSEKYKNMNEEDKKKLIDNKSKIIKEKYNKMNDEEYNNFLIKSRPYKNKYNKKKAEEKKKEDERKIYNDSIKTIEYYNKLNENKEVYIFV
jgi:hypothetical protein